MKHIKEKEYNWSYARTNSKGEVIFRHDTDETIEDAINFLKEKGIKYEEKRGATMLWVYSHEQKFSYYYTTGRWSKFSKKRFPKTHYRSKGIEDFYNRFLFPTILKERLGESNEIH